MPTVSLTDPTPHTNADAGLIATNNGNLRTLLNGGLDGANLLGTPALVSGEVPVWNGSQFVRSSVTRVGATSLGSGTPDATKFLRGDGSWQVVNTGPTFTYATTPPGSPTNGDIWYFVDSTSAPTYQWTMRYNSSEATNKWECVGGSPVQLTVAADVNTASATFVDLAGGPTFTVPRAGDWSWRIEHEAWNATGNSVAVSAAKNGAVATAEADAVKTLNTSAGNPGITGHWSGSFTGMAASDVIKQQYRAGAGGTQHFLNRKLFVIPIKVA